MTDSILRCAICGATHSTAVHERLDVLLIDERGRFLAALDVAMKEPPLFEITAEEADRILVEAGYDPVEIGRRLAKVAQDAIAARKAKEGWE